MYLEVGVTCIKVTGESLEVQEHAVTEDSWEGDHEKNDSHAGKIIKVLHGQQETNLATKP